MQPREGKRRKNRKLRVMEDRVRFQKEREYWERGTIEGDNC